MQESKPDNQIIRKAVKENLQSDGRAKLVDVGITLKGLGIKYIKLAPFLTQYSDILEIEYDKSFAFPVVYAKLKDDKTNVIISVWKPIEFSKSWEQCSTIKLDSILPSWIRRREVLKENSDEYKHFIDRLKRQHAIETGIVERLYDLKEGITETFVKEGFVEAYLQHGDSNIPPEKLMAYLQDNFAAIDFVFDVVKNDRTITISFIKELHQLITSHQETAEGRDQFGNKLQIELLKGDFKTRENNPTRPDGTMFIYCPPIHVASEMDNLILIYQDLLKRQINPLIVATWFHHAFTQIHPFQDGNGRIARLMSSLILIKHNLFPFTVKRNEKPRYIDALEWTDFGLPQPLVDFFCETQKRNIEAALNLKLDLSLSTSSLSEVADIFAQKLESKNLNLEIKRQKLISKNRMEIFDLCKDSISKIRKEIVGRLNGNAEIFLESVPPDNENKRHYFSRQILEYAIKYHYFFNRTLPRAWFRFVIVLRDKKRYELIITLHHYGYDESTFAIGAILQYNEPSKTKTNAADLTTVLPLSIEPYTISLEMQSTDINNSAADIHSFLQNVLTLTLAQIASEIN
ncbi:MAG TPA: Fic family protein [Bacteroidia bacterium]|nr:Fic family protein [Bacteroidia bacterium]